MKNRCPHCGTMNNPIRSNCSRCGTKLPITEQNAATQQASTVPDAPGDAAIPAPHTAATPAAPAAPSYKHERAETYTVPRGPHRSIQVCSSSCQMELAEYKASVKKASLRFSLTVDLPASVIVFWPFLQAIREGTPLKYAGIYKLDTIWYFIALVLFAISFFIFFKYQYPTDELIKKYQKYCNLENLTVDQSGVFGSTTKQAINLPYDQITNVRVHSTTDGGFRNDQLIIRDAYDQTHTFYSFSNARILHDAIINNMKSCGS